jgi:hypothetical protein
MSDKKNRVSQDTSQGRTKNTTGMAIPDLALIRKQRAYSYKKFRTPTIAQVKRNMEKFLSMTRMTPVGLANNIIISHATAEDMEVPADPEQYKIERRRILNKILKAADGNKFELCQSEEDNGKLKLGENQATDKRKK